MIMATLRTLLRAGTGPTGWRQTATTETPRRTTYWTTYAEEVKSGAATAILNELAPRGEWLALSARQHAHYLHVDDGVFLGPKESESKLDATMEMCADRLQDAGFCAKDRFQCKGVSKIVGYELDQARARLEFPLAKGIPDGRGPGRARTRLSW